MANAQKTPLARTLGPFAQQKALDEIRKRGAAIPGHVVSASGPIVTVNFDLEGLTLPQLVIPLLGSEYVRLPIQPGDKGVAFPIEVYLGGLTGLGGGTADTTLRGNLATLVWFPLGNKNWSSVDPNAVTIYGPNGAVLRDTASKSTMTLTPGMVKTVTGFNEMDSDADVSGGLTVGGGASGTFTTPTGQVVTVQDGIVTNIF